VLPLQRKEQHIFDAGLIREQHHKAVNADSNPRRRRHPVFERAHEIPIRFGNLLVARGALLDLAFETRTLIVRIVQLGEITTG